MAYALSPSLRLASSLLVALLLLSGTRARAEDPSAPPPRATPSTAGSLLGGVRPPTLSREESAEADAAAELAEIAAAPGHEPAAGALLQAREALARARARRRDGDTSGAARALAVTRAALELAGRQAALARERTAAAAAGRARELAVARAAAAREALTVAQRVRDGAARDGAAGEDAARDGAGAP